MKKIKAPFTEPEALNLAAGDRVLLSGVIYTARDAAHKILVEMLARGEELPFSLKDQVIYYVGPTPAPPGKAVGAAGPTTSGRMDKYTPALLAAGMRAMIGKGSRSEEVVEAIKKYRGVYFAAVGGAAALLSRQIKKVELVAFPELGPEAVYRMTVEDFPLFVINDCYGRDFYREGVKKYKCLSPFAKQL